MVPPRNRILLGVVLLILATFACSFPAIPVPDAFPPNADENDDETALEHAFQTITAQASVSTGAPAEAEPTDSSSATTEESSTGQSTPLPNGFSTNTPGPLPDLPALEFPSSTPSPTLSPTPTPQTGMIEVDVKGLPFEDAINQEIASVSDATVEIRSLGLRASNLGSGKYEFRNVPVGTKIVNVTHSNYISESQGANVTNGQPEEIIFFLVPQNPNLVCPGLTGIDLIICLNNLVPTAVPPLPPTLP